MEFVDTKYAVLVKETRDVGPVQTTMCVFKDKEEAHQKVAEWNEKFQWEYEIVWEGEIDYTNDFTLGNKLVERLGNDEHNATASDVVHHVLEIPGVVNAIIAAIPDDWQHRDLDHGSDPTKRDFAFAYTWDRIQDFACVVKKENICHDVREWRNGCKNCYVKKDADAVAEMEQQGEEDAN